MKEEIGIKLLWTAGVIFAVAGTGFAVVSRLRSLDREEAARRLADAESGRRRSERLAAAATPSSSRA